MRAERLPGWVRYAPAVGRADAYPPLARRVKSARFFTIQS